MHHIRIVKENAKPLPTKLKISTACCILLPTNLLYNEISNCDYYLFSVFDYSIMLNFITRILWNELWYVYVHLLAEWSIFSEKKTVVYLCTWFHSVINLSGRFMILGQAIKYNLTWNSVGNEKDSDIQFNYDLPRDYCTF